MGKRDTKAAKAKREDRRGKGAVKTAAKTDKAAAKQDRRKKDREDDEDLEALINTYAAKPKAQATDEVVAPPSARANASLTAHPRLEELVLFGGELFDGKKAHLYNELFRYSLKKDEWRRVSSSPSPPPRASHQAVAVPSDPPTLFVFGGEYSSPTQTQFYHYKDLWALDLVSWEWSKIEAKNGPSARSGHRMVLLRDKLAVFGGFFDNLRSVQYYNDLHLFDLGLYKWSRVPVEPGASVPLPRSGCQLVAHADSLIVFGGYFKKKAVMKQFNQHTSKGSSGGGGGSGGAAASMSDKDDALEIGHEFKDMWIFDSKAGTWSTAKRSGRPPSQRSGFSMVADAARSRLLCFGGVHDEEDPASESLRSKFFNDIYLYSLEAGKWYAPTEPHAAEAAKGAGAMDVDAPAPRAHTAAAAAAQHAAAAAAAGGSDDDELADGLADMLMETGGKRGRAARRRDDGDDAASSAYAPSSAAGGGGGGGGASAAGGGGDGGGLPGRPCARMNAQSCVRGNVLYLWGGLFESGANEVTLDDLWSLNMSKLDINRPDWGCLWRGTVATEALLAEVVVDDSSGESEEEEEPPEGEDSWDSDSSDDDSGDDDDDDGGGDEDALVPAVP